MAGGFPSNRRLSSRELTGRDHSRSQGSSRWTSCLHGAMCLGALKPREPLSLGGWDEVSRAKPDLLGPVEGGGFLCVSIRSVALPGTAASVSLSALLCFFRTHTLKMHLTLENRGFPHIKQLSATNLVGVGSRDSTPTGTGVSPDPTGKGLWSLKTAPHFRDQLPGPSLAPILVPGTNQL